MDLAQAAEMCNRMPGLMATRRRDGQADELIARGEALAGGDLAAAARLLTGRGVQRRRHRPGHRRAHRAGHRAGPPGR
jgi:hypothetical protein